ncbi:CLCA_X family protein [Shewanella goraebulensis]|uniref:CLCA_X family protein n=1 Tax=Shewanella goraebulensis TaxID=3050637 RepID=UPI00254D524F|nr:CLCA_X family protein [Shewanella goraebulensis]
MLKHSNYYRNGADYRQGQQANFIDIKHTFGLRHISVGKWVTREESDIAANLVFDSLADLSQILQVPTELIGLRKTLNLLFGRGGQKGVQAHYSPTTRELALAKNAGAGALAHEFWHAFDHYIVDKAFDISSQRTRDNQASAFNLKYSCASDLWLKDVLLKPHALNDKLSALFKLVLLSGDGERPSQYVTNAISVDKQQGSYYFSKPTELMARAFEAAIESDGYLQNQYLVSGTMNRDTASEMIYPTLEHRKLIMASIADYFALLGEAFKQQKGV